MKTTSTNSFNFENQTVTGLNMNADQGFNNLDNAHGELVGVSQPLVVGATDSADVNLLHILSELETQASQAPAVVEDAAPTAELGLILIEPSAGCRMAFPHKDIAPVAQEDWVQTEDTASTDEVVVDMKIAPEVYAHTIFIDSPVPFKGWLGDEAPHIEVDPVLVDVTFDVDADASAELSETVELVGEPVFVDPNDLPVIDAPVDASVVETDVQTDPLVDTLEPVVRIGMPIFIDDGLVLTDGETVEFNTQEEFVVQPALEDTGDGDGNSDADASAELPETVELVGEPVFVDLNDLPICIGLPIMVVDPIVWIDDGVFVFPFQEDVVVQPSVDGTDSNSTDVSVDAPQVQVCEDYPAPIFVEIIGEPEVIFSKDVVATDADTAEITLIGVAESHLA